MKRTNKHGFTLVEMMLAIAITLLISGLFITLIATIRASYYRTYNDDDCADIAAMYAEALENTILYDIQNHVASDTIQLDSHSILTNTNGACRINFDGIDNFNSNGTDDKWIIRMVCHFDASTGEFRYKFYFLDNYINPGYLHAVYEGSFWIPNYMPYQAQTIGVNDTYDPASGGTYSWDYNYTAPATDYSITCSPDGVISGDDMNGASMVDTIGGNPIYTRINNDGYGAMGVDTSSDRGSIPNSNTVITFTYSTPGGT